MRWRVTRARLKPAPLDMRDRRLGAALSSDAPSQGAGLITGGQALLEVVLTKGEFSFSPVSLRIALLLG